MIIIITITVVIIIIIIVMIIIIIITIIIIINNIAIFINIIIIITITTNIIMHYPFTPPTPFGVTNLPSRRAFPSFLRDSSQSFEIYFSRVSKAFTIEAVLGYPAHTYTETASNTQTKHMLQTHLGLPKDRNQTYAKHM